MDAVVSNIFHQRRVDALLLFNPTHAIEHLTHSNNLKVAANSFSAKTLKRLWDHIDRQVVKTDQRLQIFALADQLRFPALAANQRDKMH